ncbi:hypothetical protein PHYC_02085 [Phycisphaerales bacterium]|nr:hypothetical protein PHYC_02085 [Phycisphaerales bacterium]
MKNGTRSTSPRAFSLTEILVVISILVILIALSIPAFKNLLNNSERTLAENQLRVGLSAGRDAAIRNETGDAAAVFFFREGRMVIVPCVVVGQIQDLDSANRAVLRDVLAPLGTVEPVRLPAGWSIRAFAPAGSLDDEDLSGWYENLAGQQFGTWVFPETHFVSFDTSNVQTRGTWRHTFMVRFEGGTGLLDTAERGTALVLDPAPDSSFRGTAPFNERPRVDEADDLVVWARRLIARTDLSATEKRQLLGDMSIDTVLARPLTEVAMYEEAKMLGAIGARPNRETGTLYAPPTANTAPRFDPASLPQGVSQDYEAQDRIDQWMIGDYRVGNAGAVESDARIFVLQRYLGQMQEIVP